MKRTTHVMLKLALHFTVKGVRIVCGIATNKTLSGTKQLNYLQDQATLYRFALGFAPHSKVSHVIHYSD